MEPGFSRYRLLRRNGNSNWTAPERDLKFGSRGYNARRVAIQAICSWVCPKRMILALLASRAPCALYSLEMYSSSLRGEPWTHIKFRLSGFTGPGGRLNSHSLSSLVKTMSVQIAAVAAMELSR